MHGSRLPTSDVSTPVGVSSDRLPLGPPGPSGTPSFSRGGPPDASPLVEREDDYGGCRFIEDVYERIAKIGEGTYGKVFLAKDKASGELVAAKKVIMDTDKAEKKEEGFPITGIREIKLLLDLDHPNIINLREVVRSHAHVSNGFMGSIYMIFDYMDHDLDGLTKQMHDRGGALTDEQIKCIAKQLLQGLAYCHEQNVIHRDLKPSNLLMNNNGELKIADFGLARLYHPEINNSKMTHGVVTLWYRSPELLLGDERYTQAIDVWSAGCIIAELMLRRKILQGRDETDQIGKIMDMFGSINRASFPDCQHLPFYKNINESSYPAVGRFNQVFNHLAPDAIRLISSMLCLDPRKRITARQALNSPYFTQPPYPCHPTDLPKMEASHEWTNKRRDQKERARQGAEIAAGNGPKRPRVEGAAYPSRGAGGPRGQHHSNWDPDAGFNAGQF